MIVSFYGD